MNFKKTDWFCYKSDKIDRTKLSLIVVLLEWESLFYLLCLSNDNFYWYVSMRKVSKAREKSILNRMTCNEKVRKTAILAVLADGSTLSPGII